MKKLSFFEKYNHFDKIPIEAKTCDIKNIKNIIVFMDCRHPFRCPRIVGKYELLKCLGCGGFAYVYLATNGSSDEMLAIKVIPKKNVKTYDDQQRLQREIEATAFLHHPNIVQLHDFFSDIDNFYLVMDYCGGGSLNDYIKNPAIPKLREDQAATIFAQIVAAVDYCHERGVVHRDLKPHNVLITKFPQIKIADFGLCGYIEKGQKMNTFCGTQCYNAPECLMKNEYDAKQSDVWSLGVILYEMVTGSHPWNTSNVNAMIQQIIKAKFVVPPTVTAACDELIKSMLKLRPADRITCKQILEHPWMKLASTRYKSRSSLPSLHGNDQIIEIIKEVHEKGSSTDGIVSPFQSDGTLIHRTRSLQFKVKPSRKPKNFSSFAGYRKARPIKRIEGPPAIPNKTF